jgi:hypothetical protein
VTHGFAEPELKSKLVSARDQSTRRKMHLRT